METKRRFFRFLAIAEGAENGTPVGIRPGPSRHRVRTILAWAISLALAGFLMSYAFTPKYISKALVLVEKQEMPEGWVPSLISSDLTQRLATTQQQALAGNRLRPMLERLGLTKPEEQSTLVGEIRSNLTIEPVIIDSSSSDASTAKDVVPATPPVSTSITSIRNPGALNKSAAR